MSNESIVIEPFRRKLSKEQLPKGYGPKLPTEFKVLHTTSIDKDGNEVDCLDANVDNKLKTDKQ